VVAQPDTLKALAFARKDVSLRAVDDVPDWAIIFFIGILAYLPYAEFLHDQLGYQLFGFAAEVTVVPTVAVCILFVMIGMFRKPTLFVYALLFLGLIVIVLLSRYFLGLDLSLYDTLRQAVGLRYMMLIPMYILIAGYTLQRSLSRKLASRIIMINAAFAAFVAMLYVSGLITYRLVPEGSELQALYGGSEISRASGLSAGVNVYSNFLLLAVIVVCFAYDRSVLVRVASVAVLILGILASQSRWPLMSAVAVLGATVLVHERSGNKKRLLVVVFAVVFALTLAYLTTDSTDRLVGGVKGRLSQEMGDDIGIRQSKYEIGLNAIFESSYTALAGATPENLIQGYRQEYIFSDNGILSMFISAGIPVTLLFVFFCYWYGRQFVRNSRTLRLYVFGAIALGVAFFNNAIYWDSWLFHAAVVCFLIANTDPTAESAAGGS